MKLLKYTQNGWAAKLTKQLMSYKIFVNSALHNKNNTVIPPYIVVHFCGLNASRNF